jgi:glycerophosphoryl diester phosphodiesterase
MPVALSGDVIAASPWHSALGTSHSTIGPPLPLAVAHRAGNHLPLLYPAERLGVDLVEADLWLHRGRVEVRHFRTFGELPLPLLWDRWQLARGWGERLTLPELLSAAAPETSFMLDLKGADGRLAAQVRQTMTVIAPGRPYAVCSQSWDLLEDFRDDRDVLAIHSVGDERMLHTVRERLTWHDRHAVSIDHRLLTPARITALRRLAPMLLAWTVNGEARMRQLLEWGVTGIISDRLDLLKRLVQGRTGPAAIT